LRREDQEGKRAKLVVLVDGQGTPLGVHLASASPAEVKLLEATLEAERTIAWLQNFRRHASALTRWGFGTSGLRSFRAAWMPSSRNCAASELS
jgi:hypothetical protein